MTSTRLGRLEMKGIPLGPCRNPRVSEPRRAVQYSWRAPAGPNRTPPPTSARCRCRPAPKRYRDATYFRTGYGVHRLAGGSARLAWMCLGLPGDDHPRAGPPLPSSPPGASRRSTFRPTWAPSNGGLIPARRSVGSRARKADPGIDSRVEALVVLNQNAGTRCPGPGVRASWRRRVAGEPYRRRSSRLVVLGLKIRRLARRAASPRRAIRHVSPAG